MQFYDFINLSIDADVCDDYCENEGNCVKDSRTGAPSCRCIGSFTGKHCAEKSEFAYIAGGIAASVILIIFIVLLIWMICARYLIFIFYLTQPSCTVEFEYMKHYRVYEMPFLFYAIFINKQH